MTRRDGAACEEEIVSLRIDLELREQPRKRLAYCCGGRAIDDHAHGPCVSCLNQQDHRLAEIRVLEPSAGYQQGARARRLGESLSNLPVARLRRTTRK